MADSKANSATIHVACAADAGYFKHCAAMLASVFAFNRDAHAHILCGDDVPEADRVKLTAWAEARGARVDCIVPRVELPQSMPGIQRLTRAAWLRLFLPELLPDLDRVIYLDVDVLVQDSLKELWDVDLKGNWAAAVEDIQVFDRERARVLPDGDSYFNSGVMLIDLARFREERVASQALEVAAEHPELISYADQDALNVVLRSRWLHLPLRLNSQARIFERPEPPTPLFSAEEVREARDRPAVLHFCGNWKPWHYRCKHPRRNLYDRYRRQTPWPEWTVDGRSIKHRMLRPFPDEWQWWLTWAYWSVRNKVGPSEKK